MLKTIEMILGWLGLAAIVLLTGVVLISMARAQRHTGGRNAGAVRRTLGRPYMIAVAIGYLALCVILWIPLPPIPEPVQIAALALGSLAYFGGAALVLWGRTALGEMHNVSTTLGGAELFADHRLITAGPYRHVRHPMYVGAILMGLGGVLMYHTWTLVLIAAHLPIFYFRAAGEEKALAAQFGAEWEEYKRRVPAWIPRLGRGA